MLAIASKTRCRMSGRTASGVFSTRDTVPSATPAARATSTTVGGAECLPDALAEEVAFAIDCWGGIISATRRRGADSPEVPCTGYFWAEEGKRGQCKARRRTNNPCGVNSWAGRDAEWRNERINSFVYFISADVVRLSPEE